MRLYGGDILVDITFHSHKLNGHSKVSRSKNTVLLRASNSSLEQQALYLRTLESQKRSFPDRVRSAIKTEVYLSHFFFCLTHFCDYKQAIFSTLHISVIISRPVAKIFDERFVRATYVKKN